MRCSAAGNIVAIAFLVVSACSRAGQRPKLDAAGEADLPCAIDSDAGVGAGGPPYCYPVSTMPTGPCSPRTPSCVFCGYPPCPITSGLVEPHSLYKCRCDQGSWSCAVTKRFGDACAPVLTCLGPDGGVGAVCLSGAGVSCTMRAGATQPVCALAGGVVPQACGVDSCSTGCTCSDAAAPSCICRERRD
jgi:hypothetical protein